MISESVSGSVQYNTDMTFRKMHTVSNILDTHRIPISAHKYYTGSGIKTFKKTVDRSLQYKLVIN